MILRFENIKTELFSLLPFHQNLMIHPTIRRLSINETIPRTDLSISIRSGSKTFGKWQGVTLSAENRKQFYISPGFAHGFLVLSDEAEFCYKCTDFYHPGNEGGIAWNDPSISIDWPGISGAYKGTASSEGYSLRGTLLIISDKDQKWPALQE